MPQRPNRPCLHRSCSALTRSASGYCDAHQGEVSGWSDYNAGRTNTERGYGADWRKLRAWVLRRDHGLCQPCHQAGQVTLATEVDHVVSKAQAARLGWTRHQMDDHGNLQAICRECHQAKTAREHTKQRGD